MPPEFVHLHNHSDHSLLDSSGRIEKYLTRLGELGMNSIAITDHGSMSNLYNFHDMAQNKGIKPILGVELYYTQQPMSERDKTNFHLLALAENEQGFRNLVKLSSIANTKGFYRVGRVDLDTLSEYSEGIILTSGCLAAPIPRAILSDATGKKAKALINSFRDIFPGRFYLEVMDHPVYENGRQIQTVVNNWLFENNDGLPIIATNDTHYVYPEDAKPHECLLCIQTDDKMSNPNRFQFQGDDYYLKSPQEMWNIWGERPDVLKNTLAVAERVSEYPLSSGYLLPTFEVPNNYSSNEEYLRDLCFQGLHKRYKDVDSTQIGRIEHELEIISNLGFVDYFLIVHDVTNYMRENGILSRVRGSASGSIVAYVLFISDLCPLKHNLYFERFLNPDRVSMPDIDIDIPDVDRAHVIRYISRKYGERSVAAIATYGTMKNRSAVKRIAQAYDFTPSVINAVTKQIDNSKPLCLDTIRYPSKYKDELAGYFDLANKLVGVTHFRGIHPAALVITPGEVTDHFPVFRNKSGETDLCTQPDMKTIDKHGGLKIDFLGLKTLRHVKTAIDMIHSIHGEVFPGHEIPYEYTDDNQDQHWMLNAAFEMLKGGDTSGVFQLESDGMANMLRNMQPHLFLHIVAAVALYRPGPMEFIPVFNRRLHGEEPIEFIHPKLEPILGDTMGVLVFQEQIMRIAIEVFGYSGAEADDLRYGVGKKIADKVIKHREKFVNKASYAGMTKAEAETIFDYIERFANYGFNLSHATSYAALAVQTAVLKATYPVEFFASLMNSYSDNYDKVRTYLLDASDRGIQINPPDINRSQEGFAVEQGEIYYGFSSVKTLGAKTYNHILDVRGSGFDSLDDFLKRVSSRIIKQSHLETLIKCGFFDLWGFSRASLLASIDNIVNCLRRDTAKEPVGQMAMFALDELIGPVVITPKPEVDLKEILNWETHYMGIHISRDPLEMECFSPLRKSVSPFSQIITFFPGTNVICGGLVAKITTQRLKSGATMAHIDVIDIHDKAATIPVKSFFWDDDMQENDVVKIWGQYDVYGGQDQVKLLRYEIVPIAE